MRKSTLLIFMLLSLISCKQSSKSSFHGFGELQIGARFDSIPSFKLFEKKSENEFELNKFEITEAIGYVENVVVVTEKGRIYEVSFSTGKFSNNSSIEAHILSGSTQTFADSKNDLTLLDSHDGMVSITFFESEELSSISGFHKIFYSYVDSKLSLEKYKKEYLLKDSIEKLEYLKDVKTLK